MICTNDDYEKILDYWVILSASIGASSILLSRVDSARNSAWIHLACGGFISFTASILAANIARNGMLATVCDVVKELSRYRFG